MSEKELRFIDPTSFTIMNTSITFVFSIIISIILLIVTAMNGMISVALMFIPLIIFGTLIFKTFSSFIGSALYNVFVTRLNCVKLDIGENGEIKNISAVSSALILALIAAIIAVVVYLVIYSIFPIIFMGLFYTLMYSGQMLAAMVIAQLLSPVIQIIMTPLYAVIVLVVLFIVIFICELIQFGLYNLLTGHIGGAVVELKTEAGITTLEAIDPIKTAIIFTVVGIIISLIFGIISGVLTGNYMNILTTVIGGAIGSFVGIIIAAALYNYLSKKLGKVKVELI